MTQTKNKKVIAIVGATASGKTAYSVELAKRLDGEIISADSRLVYNGFDIGTAKPNIDERQGIKHHMIDVVEPCENYTSALYVNQAKLCIDEIISNNKTPIIVGGTGLYFRLLLENYQMPEAAPNYDLRNQLELKTSEELYLELTKLDEKSALTIEKNDKKKLIRALEIVKTLSKPMNEVRGISEKPDYEIDWIGLNFNREELYERINLRVEQMIEMGLIKEVQDLLFKYGRVDNLVNTIGYKEMLSYIDGKTSLEDAKDLLKQNTRNYAKRQLTWFRKNQNIKWNIYPDKLKK
ncbi:MAG: tRNA (adenosine(37)-N6)-dimethylallyltransferase MiaA [Candidatus Gastranaerophilales bacterium]